MTPKGKEVLHKAHQLGGVVEKQILESFSVKEQKELVQLLKKLVVDLYSKNKEKGTKE